MTQLELFVDTLAVARDGVEEDLEEGSYCPCCGQFCKLYRRTINAAMARALINLVRIWEANPRWINIHEMKLVQGRRAGGDFAKLRWWGLIEAKENEDESKKDSGMWRPTEAGREFVYLQLTVPKYVLVYNNQVRSSGPEKIDIKDSLKAKFNYAELMGWKILGDD